MTKSGSNRKCPFCGIGIRGTVAGKKRPGCKRLKCIVKRVRAEVRG